ncbi:hypothetical protein BV20DRAFT_963738 [Pilatotrama ljubarskyi]|nr:hypothetical protein BV20DRAFT_963738 [Pilatotrama ljubarskyi]
MRYSFFSLAIALFTSALVASPAIGHAIPASTDASSIAASFPVSDLRVSDAHPHLNATAPQSNFHSLVKRQEFPATLLLCPLTGCGACSGFNLAAFPEDECFDNSFEFFSVAISQPSNIGLPFVVGVGPAPCTSVLEIPAVNECFNVNGAIFDAFALLP